MRPEDFQELAPGRVIKAIQGHWTFAPHPLPPQLHFSIEQIARLSDADRALGELAGVGRMLPNPQLLIRPFISREAVLSSQIEGTLTKLDQLLLFEAQPNDIQHPADAEEVMNYVRAANFGLNAIRGGYPFSWSLVEEVHRILMEGVRKGEKRPGQLRDRAVFLGHSGQSLEEARFVPTCHTQLRPLLDDFILFLRDGRELPPIVQLALIHYQFETIHPFNDGNGRVGRLLITLLLCERQILPEPLLYLSAYFEQHRQEYYDHLLDVSRRGSWNEWIDFVAVGVAEQSRDATLRSRRLLAMWQQYRQRASEVLRSTSALRIVDELFASPFLTIERAANIGQVTRPAAQNSINRLVEAGLLKEITGKRRYRVYVADEILQLLDAPLTPEAP